MDHQLTIPRAPRKATFKVTLDYDGTYLVDWELGTGWETGDPDGNGIPVTVGELTDIVEAVVDRLGQS